MDCILESGAGRHAHPAIGAVLLAAGAGERIGRRPKCLLELDGVPLIRRQITALSQAGVGQLVVVVGHHAELVLPSIETALVTTVVRNPSPDEGQISSQRLGLAALAGKLEAVIVALADQPLITAQDIDALIGAWAKRGAGIAVIHPEVDGERGNPVIFDAQVRDEILAANAGTGCRQWQAEHPERVAPFVIASRHYKVDIDTVEDIALFERETGRALRWPAAMAREEAGARP